MSGHPGIAILFALASFVGFEATAIYGEESRNPTRTVPLATYAAVSIIMVFFAFTTWAIISCWTSALATIGIVGLQFLVSAAVIVFFRRNGLDKRVWNTIVAPVLGMVGLGYALFLLVVNLPALSGSDVGLVRSFPWIMLGVMLVGMGVSLGISKRGSRIGGLDGVVGSVVGTELKG